MADTSGAESRRTKDRSPSFPFIPLQAAVDRLSALEKSFGRHPTPADKAGLAWGMKAKSSQADQTLAALRSFGLVTYEGIGSVRQVAITDEARTYLRAQQDDIKKQVLRQCALRPKIIRKFWSAWGADRPHDAVALDELSLRNGFSDAGAENFLKVYDATIAYAGLLSSDKIVANVNDGLDDGDDDPTPSAVKTGDLIQWMNGGVDQFASPTKVIGVSEDGQWLWVAGSNTGIPMAQVRTVTPAKEAGAPPQMPEHIAAAFAEGERRPVRPGMKEEKNALDEGEAVLILPENLSPESVRDLQYWLEGILKKAKRRAGLRTPAMREKLGKAIRANMIAGGVPSDSVTDDKIEDILDQIE